jgi:hypothetical protein
MISLLDEGTPAPNGGKWHERIEIDGRVWNKGDEFYLFDRHGAPRPMVFVHYYTGYTEGTPTVCYSRQHFRRTIGAPSMPVGFVNELPVENAVSMSRIQIAASGVASDLREAGLDAAADELMETYRLDEDELPAAIEKAQAILDAMGDDE